MSTAAAGQVGAGRQRDKGQQTRFYDFQMRIAREPT